MSDMEFDEDKIDMNGDEGAEYDQDDDAHEGDDDHHDEDDDGEYQEAEETEEEEEEEEHEEEDVAVGHAIRIISIDDKGEGFSLDEEALHSILSSIPEDMKVAVISVVGAFRTGKSFLLDLFLRYLKATRDVEVAIDGEPDQKWLEKVQDTTVYQVGESLNGNFNNKEINTTEIRESEGGFGWRSGKDRCTTGIWMWSEYFIREVPKERSLNEGNEDDEDAFEKIAVLLIDTQGMFDSSTGQMLTASIFGLSTLISSYQIYNMDKRIQEDNLQHLALFTEYGRVVLNEERRASAAKLDLAGIDFEAELEAELKEEKKSTDTKNEVDPAQSEPASVTATNMRPFQRLELLVRDWQNFEDEDGPMDLLRKDMKNYLEQVLNERSQKDLKQVREQIRDCFETVSCFLLPHPGFEVTKKGYDGNLQVLRPTFKRMLSEYVRLVFTARLVPKKIYGRAVTAKELSEFIKVYASLFKEGKIFPEAKTLLAATSEANNRSALDMAIRTYKSMMDPHLGANKSFVEEPKLKEFHQQARLTAIKKFSSVATLGPKADILKYRRMLDADITAKHAEYVEANKLRDPFSFVGPFVIPLLIAVFAYIARIAIDWTCFGLSEHCVSTSQFLQMLYTTVFAFAFFHAISTGHGVRKRIQRIFGIILEAEGISLPSMGNKIANAAVTAETDASKTTNASEDAGLQDSANKKDD